MENIINVENIFNDLEARTDGRHRSEEVSFELREGVIISVADALDLIEWRKSIINRLERVCKMEEEAYLLLTILKANMR